MRRLDDLVAIVTGAGGVIGAAAAKRLAEEGAKIVATDIDAEHATRTADFVQSVGGDAIAVRADVGDPDDVATMVKLAISHYGRIDVLFNNAGIAGTRTPVHQLEVTEFDTVLRVNLRGAFLVLRESLRAMIAGGRGGAIVNMSSSMAGWDVLDGGSAYAASKHAVLGLTRVAALDAAPYGIRINALCPGVIETPLGIPDLADGTRGIDRFAARIPLRRVGSPADVAAAVAFLASSDAAHVTGVGLLIDGGQTLQSWSNAPSRDQYPAAADDQLDSINSSGGHHE